MFFLVFNGFYVWLYKGFISVLWFQMGLIIDFIVVL